jgi:hypothetical protein
VALNSPDEVTGARLGSGNEVDKKWSDPLC